MRQKLASLAVTEEEKQAAENAYTDFLKSVWTEDAMFMNYLEGLQFASSCAGIVATSGTLTTADMESVFKKQKAVMTVRGPVRDEYKASMDLSRL